MLTRKNKSSSALHSEVGKIKRPKMTDKEVCKTCNDDFDDSSRRPRVLPCGHTCCSHCINACIKNGSLNCPGCKKVHKVKLAEDLPPNIYLEEILAKTLEQNKHEDEEDKENVPTNKLKSKNSKNVVKKDVAKFNAGTCPEHDSCLLDNRCVSHKCWVCSECIEEDHPENSCQIVTFKCEIENRMKQQECLLDAEFINCQDATEQLRTYISRVKAEEERHDEVLESLEEMIKRQRESKIGLTKEINEGMLLLEKGEQKQKSLTSGKKVLKGISTLQEANSIRQDVKTWLSASKNWISVSQEKFEGSTTIYEAMQLRMKTKMLLNLEKFCNDEVDVKVNGIKKETEESQNEIKQSNEEIVSEEEENSLDQIEEKELFANMKMKLVAKLMLQHVQTTHNVKMDFNGSVDWEKLAKTNVMDRMYLVLLNEALIQPETIKAGAYAVVENSKGTKSAHLSVQEGRIHLHALENTEPPENSYTIPMLPLQNFINPEQPSVFMDLCAGGRWLGRVYIRLIGQSRHAQQFLALCLGVLGATYRGARFSEVGFRGMPGECVVCEEYVTETGTSNKGILDGLVSEGDEIRRQGMVFKSTWDGADFLICTRDLRNNTFRCPIGEVVSGLNVVREASRGHGPIREVIITAVGAVLDGNLSGAPAIVFDPKSHVTDIPLPPNSSEGSLSMDITNQDMDLGNKSYDFGSQSSEVDEVKTEDSKEHLKSVLKIKNENTY